MKGLLTASLILLAATGCEVHRGASTRQAAADAGADRLLRQVEADGARLTIDLAPARPRLADEIVLQVTLQLEARMERFPAEFGERLGDFEVREVRELPARLSDRVDTYRYRLVLEPRRVGQARLLPLAWTFRDPRDEAGRRRVIETPELRIQVDSRVPVDQSRLEQVELAGLYRSPSRWLGIWLASGAGLLLAVLLFGAAWLVLRRKQPVGKAPARSPGDEALADLERLQREGWAERDVKEFFVRLTSIVRTFIERSTGVLAVEQTTPEFLRAIQAGHVFDQEDQRRLEEFLEAADLIKFAAFLPGDDDVKLAWARAREFVERQARPRDEDQAMRGEVLA